MASVDLRPMQAEDCESVKRLHKFAKSNGTPIFSQYGSDAALVLEAAAAAREGCFGIIAVQLDEDGDEEVLGAVTAQKGGAAAAAAGHQGGSTDQVVLLTLVVRSDARRQGLGQSLMAAVVEETQQERYRAVVADVGVCNEAALSFFKQLGFVCGEVQGTTMELCLSLQSPGGYATCRAEDSQTRTSSSSSGVTGVACQCAYGPNKRRGPEPALESRQQLPHRHEHALGSSLAAPSILRHRRRTLGSCYHHGLVRRALIVALR